MTTASAKIPDPLTIDALRAGVMKDRGIDPDGLYYWTIKRRGEDGGRLWSGRDSPAGVRERMIKMLADGKGEGPVQSSVHTVGALLDDWLASRLDNMRSDTRPDGLDIKTLSKNRTQVAHLKASTLSGIKLETLESAHLKIYKDARKAAPATLKLEIGSLMAALTWCGDQKKYKGVRLGRVRAPKIYKVFVRPKYTPPGADVEKVIAWLRASERVPAWVPLAVSIQHELGARRCGPASLLVSDVHFSRDSITLTEKKTRKNPDGKRTVKLPESLATELREWIASNGLTGDDRVLTVTKASAMGKINDEIKKACAAVHVERFTTHGIRRRMVDDFIAHDVHVAPAAAHLGHTPAVMLEEYAKVRMETMAAGLDKVHAGRAKARKVKPAKAPKTSKVLPFETPQKRTGE